MFPSVDKRCKSKLRKDGEIDDLNFHVLQRLW
jgi:hypothetical protein